MKGRSTNSIRNVQNCFKALQVVIALIVTPEGLPLTYEVLSGNTADATTLPQFLARIEQLYGSARRIWVMDRGTRLSDKSCRSHATRPIRRVPSA